MAEEPDRVVEQPKAKPRPLSSDIASIVRSAGSGVGSAINKLLIGQWLDTGRDNLESYLKSYDTLCSLAQKGDLVGLNASVFATLVSDGKILIDLWKAGIGIDMGSAFLGLVESYKGYSQLLSCYISSRFDNSIRPVLDRYFNTIYTTNIPNERTAFAMLMEGLISRSEFNNYLSQLGWSSYWHDKLYHLYDREPDIYFAFSLYKRGLISYESFKQCVRIAGYDASWDTVIYEGLHRRPTFRELITLADYVPLPQLWVTEVLRANGYKDTDINYIGSAIDKRALREEVRNVLGRLVFEYEVGRRTRSTLEDEMKDLGILPTELSLWLSWADLRYADKLKDWQTDIIEERVHKLDPELVKATKEETITAIVTQLKNLGYVEEMANLMAEYWYWSYVVT